MSPSPSANRDFLILIYAPAGRDASLLHQLFTRANMQSQVCLDINQVCREIELGVGALFVTEEALRDGAIESLSATLHARGAGQTFL